MAKRKAKKPARSARPARKTTPARRSSAKRPSARKATGNTKTSVRKAAPPSRAKVKGRAAPAKAAARKPPLAGRPGAKGSTKTPRLDRARRTLDETTPGPPSSLDLERGGSAARTGRAEFAETLREHHGMMDVTGGDPDVDIEDAYFTGEEAPGGDNPTPDQDIVDDIGKALGVEYQDNEELKASDKIVERDKHRWELDPASAEDYKDRK